MDEKIKEDNGTLKIGIIIAILIIIIQIVF